MARVRRIIVLRFRDNNVFAGRVSRKTLVKAIVSDSGLSPALLWL